MAAAAKAHAALARFAPNPRRRAMLAQVHIAPKQLGLDDDSYRAILMRETGRMSAAECTDAELETVIAAFKRQGFTKSTDKPGAARKGPARADHPMARKARALWLSLGYLCAIDNPAEKALEGFAKRQLGCDRLQWANQSQSDRLIEALKAIAERHGWDQSAKGLAKDHYIRVLWARLADAILFKLRRAGIADGGWMLHEAAFRLCGIEAAPVMLMSNQTLQNVCQALGAKLREHGGRDAFDPVQS